MGNCVITICWKNCDKNDDFERYIKVKAIFHGFSVNTDMNYLYYYGREYHRLGLDVSGLSLMCRDYKRIISEMEEFGKSIQSELIELGAVDVKYNVEFLPM